jgi:hypothetical protein
VKLVIDRISKSDNEPKTTTVAGKSARSAFNGLERLSASRSRNRPRRRKWHETTTDSRAFLPFLLIISFGLIRDQSRAKRVFAFFRAEWFSPCAAAGKNVPHARVRRRLASEFVGKKASAAAAAVQKQNYSASSVNQRGEKTFIAVSRAFRARIFTPHMIYSFFLRARGVQ